MKRYNLKKVIENLKSIEGKYVFAIMAYCNGRHTVKIEGEAVGPGKLNSNTCELEGILKVYVNEEDLLKTKLDIGGTIFTFLGSNKDRCYQSGLAHLACDGEILYNNPIIVGSSDQFIYSVSEVFDDESVKEIYANWVENPYNQEFEWDVFGKESKISNLTKEEWVEQNLKLNPTVTKEELENFYDTCEKYGVEISDTPLNSQKNTDDGFGL